VLKRKEGRKEGRKGGRGRWDVVGALKREGQQPAGAVWKVWEGGQVGQGGWRLGVSAWCHEQLG